MGLPIGEVARRSGLPATTLRYYESAGLLPPPARVNGRRRYEPSVLETLRLIGLARRAGLTISEIGALLHGFAADTPPPARWQVLGALKLAEVDAQIAALHERRTVITALLGCSCASLADCARA